MDQGYTPGWTYQRCPIVRLEFSRGKSQTQLVRDGVGYPGSHWITQLGIPRSASRQKGKYDYLKKFSQSSFEDSSTITNRIFYHGHFQVTYLNEYASFEGPNTVKTVNKKGVAKSVSAASFILATGGRPKYPDIPGAREFGLTSDDLFSLRKPPGKTLLVGASYIALECGGFLNGLVKQYFS